jgi:GMP synthase (glutamine-hydrolysing)
MARQVVVVQHVACEGLGRIAPLLDGLDVTWIRAGAPVPSGCEPDALIVLGGPMGVYEADAHPRLRDELALIERALARDIPILGICLGSQLLAAALGARVYPTGTMELGWYDVTRLDGSRDDALFSSLPPIFPALHWHGDAFDLPAGAVALARSEATTFQAFRHGARAWGILFHLEADEPQVRAMCETFDAPTSLITATAAFDARASQLARTAFGAWTALI